MIVIKKIKIDYFIALILIYFTTFFFLNRFFFQLRPLLTKEGYYLVFTFLEYWAFALIIKYVINNPRFSKLIFGLSILFSIFLFVHTFTLSYRRLDSIPIGVETILIFIFIFFFFYQHFKKAATDHIYNDPGFWIIAGILIYLGSSFFFNILANEVDGKWFLRYWYLTYIGDIFKNILFSIAIIIYTKNPVRKSKIKTKQVPYLDMI